MAYYYIVASDGDSRTDLDHHKSREHAEELAEDAAGHVRPVDESVVSEDTPRCGDCGSSGSEPESDSGDSENASDSPQSESSTNGGDGSDDADGDSDADSQPTCAGTTSDGEPCSREVDEEGDYCFQHSE